MLLVNRPFPFGFEVGFTHKLLAFCSVFSINVFFILYKRVGKVYMYNVFQEITTQSNNIISFLNNCCFILHNHIA
jgi:hypothetical protein